jgi:hypothetical protein
MAKDRSRDDRRSVGSHQKMMAALGRTVGDYGGEALDNSTGDSGGHAKLRNPKDPKN